MWSSRLRSGRSASAPESSLNHSQVSPVSTHLNGMALLQDDETKPADTEVTRSMEDAIMDIVAEVLGTVDPQQPVITPVAPAVRPPPTVASLVESSSGNPPRGCFPGTLHAMITKMDTEAHHAGRWSTERPGHFLIDRDAVDFRRIMPTFFTHGNFHSLRRQLHVYGFKRVIYHGDPQDWWYHPVFTKGAAPIDLKSMKPGSKGLPTKKRVMQTRSSFMDCSVARRTRASQATQTAVAATSTLVTPSVKIPSAIMVPSSIKTPSTCKTPAVTKTPSTMTPTTTVETPAATKNPATIKTPSNMTPTTTTETPTATKTPSTIKIPTTKTPATMAPPTITETPAVIKTTKTPTATKKSAVKSSNMKKTGSHKSKTTKRVRETKETPIDAKRIKTCIVSPCGTTPTMTSRPRKPRPVRPSSAKTGPMRKVVVDEPTASSTTQANTNKKSKANGQEDYEPIPLKQPHKARGSATEHSDPAFSLMLDAFTTGASLVCEAELADDELSFMEEAEGFSLGLDDEESGTAVCAELAFYSNLMGSLFEPIDSTGIVDLDKNDVTPVRSMDGTKASSRNSQHNVDGDDLVERVRKTVAAVKPGDSTLVTTESGTNQSIEAALTATKVPTNSSPFPLPEAPIEVQVQQEAHVPFYYPVPVRLSDDASLRDSSRPLAPTLDGDTTSVNMANPSTTQPTLSYSDLIIQETLHLHQKELLNQLGVVVPVEQIADIIGSRLPATGFQPFLGDSGLAYPTAPVYHNIFMGNHRGTTKDEATLPWSSVNCNGENRVAVAESKLNPNLDHLKTGSGNLASHGKTQPPQNEVQFTKPRASISDMSSMATASDHVASSSVGELQIDDFSLLAGISCSVIGSPNSAFSSPLLRLIPDQPGSPFSLEPISLWTSTDELMNEADSSDVAKFTVYE